MTLQASTSSVKKRPTSRAAFISWLLTPRSTDRDKAFRERSIRIALSLIISLVLLSFSISVFGFHNQWAIISIPSLHVFVLITSALSAVFLVRERLEASGWMLIITILIGASGFMVLAGRDGSTFLVYAGIPELMLAVVSAALMLPRSQVLPVSLASAVLISVVIWGLQTSGYNLPNLDFGAVITQALFVLLTAGAILWRLRGEFDERLEALRELVHQTEVAKQQAEVARQQAEVDRQRAEHADKTKSQFLANMSHELRTPLNAIIGYDEAMLGGMVGAFAPEQTKLLGHIQNNSRRLLSLIDDVLDLSKIEAGSIQIYSAPVYPRKTVQDIADSLQSIAQQQGTTLTVNFAESVPEIVMNDNKKLQQILTNLISNAIKFTPKGSVSVEVDSTDKNNWQFKVCDTGIGMPADAPSYIFEPFRQVDGAESRRFKGTGLGLAITKRFVDYMGGSIAVESELGKGSTFTIVLPRVVSSDKPTAH